MRKSLKSNLKKLNVNGMFGGSQPLALSSNRRLASFHRNYGGDAVADVKKLELDVGKADSKPLRESLERDAEQNDRTWSSCIACSPIRPVCAGSAASNASSRTPTSATHCP